MQPSDVVAVVSLATSAVAIIVSFLVARKQNELATKDLTLTAYSNAVEGILGLKDMFKQEHDLFDAQIKKAKLEEFLPEGMDSRTFLMFTNGFWRFSYVYSVMKRGEKLGLTPNECKGLEEEMKIWLEDIPGFREVYTSLIKKARNHNPDYLDWLEKLYNQPESAATGPSTNHTTQSEQINEQPVIK